MPITTCVFDAYGTLFDVSAAAREASKEEGRSAFSKNWMKVASDWRNKQLQYTWLRAVTGDHTDFWEVTQNGLDWALEANGHSDPELRERLLQLYWELSAYSEVPRVLADLRASGQKTAILSNGSPEMLNGAVESAGIGDLLDDILSVEDVGIFKPSARVYDLVGTKMGVENSQVLFVSSNGWDAGCATGYGFQTAWVNRSNEPVDRLPWRPSHHITDLTSIPEIVAHDKTLHSL